MCPCRFRASPRSSRRSCQNGRGTRFIPTAPRERRINTSVHVLDRCKRPCTHACHVCRRVSIYTYVCINYSRRVRYGEPRMRDMGGGEEREQSARAFHHRLCPRKLVSLWRSSIETLLRSLKGHRSGHTVYFMKRKLLDRKPDRIMVCTVRREPREWWSVGWSTIGIEHSFIWRCNK